MCGCRATLCMSLLYFCFLFKKKIIGLSMNKDNKKLSDNRKLSPDPKERGEGRGERKSQNDSATSINPGVN